MSHSEPQAAVGIASIGVQLPPLAMDMSELAQLRGADVNKYRHGLGCDVMALCPEGYGVVDLAVGAAKRALGRWRGDVSDIGLVSVGSESALDMSRPLSAWVASELGLRGNFRSYEVKHACYGGTLALRQAVEWKLANVQPGKAALVIATDVALYAEGDPGEPTQGAGAVAMIVEDGLVASIARASYPYSEPAFDFWRPVGCAFPLVEGPLSLDCYQRATAACYEQLLAGEAEPFARLMAYGAHCFHVPFPKMVKKAVSMLGQAFTLDEGQLTAFFEEKVQPSLAWNKQIGNAYTASLWISVADQLRRLAPGTIMTAFSYGSGFGAELFEITAGPECARGAWARDVESDLASRRLVKASEYTKLRSGERRVTASVPPAAAISA